MSIDEVIKRHVLDVLHKHRGDKRAAAKELGIGVKTLYNWLHRWNEMPPLRKRQEGE